MACHLELPPTINTLDRHQRLRLIRSNRKLEAVLGSVPYYPEPELSELAFHESNMKARRRGGRIFGHSPSPTLSASSSTTSLSSTEDQVLLNKSFNYTSSRVKQSAPSKSSTQVSQLSRPLLLRLRSVPLRPSSRRASISSSVAPSSPTSPRFTIDLENLQSAGLEQRRRKMARVIRTLGENIPPELVFPPRSPDTAEKPSTKQRSTERKPIPSNFTSPSHHLAQPPVISKPKALSRVSAAAGAGAGGTSVTTAQRSRITTPTAPRPSLDGNTGASRGPTIAERRRKTRPRSLSLSTGTDILVAAAAQVCADTDSEVPSTEAQPTRAAKTLTIDEKATKDILQIRSPLAFQTTIPGAPSAFQHRYAQSSPSNINFDVNVRVEALNLARHAKSASVDRNPSSIEVTNAPSSLSSSSSSSRYGKRRERGWSGEWNQNLDHVVKALRNMKAR